MVRLCGSRRDVEVVARFGRDGTLSPTAIIWEDGREFLVDRILDTRRAASLKAGGQGIRYTCRILGRERYLWYDDIEHLWFVEAK